MPVRAEDPVLVSSRREAVVVLLIWLAACIYTVTYCYQHGYGRDVDSLRFVAGIPDWVFYGIVVPWTICTLLSFWVSNFLIKDQDLGEEQPEAELGKEADHA
ncbi:MAG: DUF997 family protein [Pirellulaceae bacterium]